jgi:hypothetical protein
MWTFESGGCTSAFIGDVATLNCHCFFRDGHAYDWLRTLDDLPGRFGDRDRLYLGHGTSPVGTEVLDWQRGYIRAFLHAVADRPDREDVIAAMKQYLPTDATLFLLDYELEKTIPRYLEERVY